MENVLGQYYKDNIGTKLFLHSFPNAPFLFQHRIAPVLKNNFLPVLILCDRANVYLGGRCECQQNNIGIMLGHIKFIVSSSLNLKKNGVITQ